MLACRTSILSYKSYPAPACRPAGRRSFAFCISFGPSMSYKSRPVPACWHARRQSCHIKIIWRPDAGMPEVKLCLLNLLRHRYAGMLDAKLYLLNLVWRRHAGMPDMKLCLIHLVQQRHSGMLDVKLCLSNFIWCWHAGMLDIPAMSPESAVAFWIRDGEVRKRRPRASNGQQYPLPCCRHFGNLKCAQQYKGYCCPLLARGGLFSILIFRQGSGPKEGNFCRWWGAGAL